MGKKETETISNPERGSQGDNLPNGNFPKSKSEYVRNKMEAMQKKIDELKEKVKNEGELLHNETSFKTDEMFQDPLNSIQNNFEQQTSENESGSDKSLYYSASNYSLCSLSTSSSENAYNNFSRFVNNFVKNQNQKERLSLLQLHSKKQISLNIMRHSLSELDTRCTEELELIERSLRHLTKLATEFNVNIPPSEDNENRKLKALEFHSTENRNSKKLKVLSNNVFIWPHEERKSVINTIYNPTLSTIPKLDNSTIQM